MAITDPWVECFFVGALQMRCSVVTDRSTGDTVIIDGGSEPGRLIDWIDRFGGRGPDWSNGPSNLSEAEQQHIPERTVIALVNTHAHFDHSGHIPDLLEHYRVKWYLHEDDTYLQTLAQSSARRWGFDAPEPAVADEGLVPLTTMSFGALDFEVLHTPGHTLGGCCLNLLVDNGANHLFVGDTLFAGSVGRTDLPDTGGDFEVLAASIHTQLWPLEGDTIVYPGHGPLTTIGHERRTNPFVGEGAGAGGTFGRGKYA
ncbi:MAG: MBL fold metallo-hydrolase [Candidatus Poseidoniaceae archaeon]|nr:MBL fold metallo-hydrolase [Candidatus Poseidoniaceae archaeon]MDG1558082.1 MBL fold metallo-hydrolase [Candidatus Poseidoniaceae archaeon]